MYTLIGLIMKRKLLLSLPGVFDRDDVADIHNCCRRYGDEKITEVLLNTKFLSEVQTYLAAAVIDRPLTDFGCYRLKQLNPELFPY